MAKETVSIKSLTPLFIALFIGAAVGIAKFLLEDIIGFSLIIVFPLVYGFLIGYALSLVFAKFPSKKNSRMALAAVSVTFAILTFFYVEHWYVEGILLELLEAEGEATAGFYLDWGLYFQLLGESGTEVGKLGRSTAFELTGALFYALMLFEFALMYYFAIRNVMAAKGQKNITASG